MELTLAEEFLEMYTPTHNEKYCHCTIEWKNGRYEENDEREDVTIKITPNAADTFLDEEDDEIFFYINSVEELKDLSNPDTTQQEWFISDIDCIE